jgi:hypothetical protein
VPQRHRHLIHLENHHHRHHHHHRCSPSKYLGNATSYSGQPSHALVVGDYPLAEQLQTHTGQFINGANQQQYSKFQEKRNDSKYQIEIVNGKYENKKTNTIKILNRLRTIGISNL